uniref:Uncharacterized protein n=1 Tax=Anguilla anguilla TaxID=7936 RepID=A0A0E9QM34_ANGAN
MGGIQSFVFVCDFQLFKNDYQENIVNRYFCTRLLHCENFMMAHTKSFTVYITHIQSIQYRCDRLEARDHATRNV